MRDTMPSPPFVAYQVPADGAPLNRIEAAPLSWNPPVAPPSVELAKFAVMSP